jgi:uncharacterized membrane protein (UPF0127 family)
VTDRGARAAVAVAVAAVAVLGPVGCSGESPGTGGVRFDDRVVNVEIADEPAERQLGLMNRTRLGANDGMLFLFGRPTTTGFWMKNTLIPLSIAYLRDLGEGRFEVVNILDMEPCRLADTSRCPRYRPGASYHAALEVNQGWFEDAGIEVGAEARFEPDP